MANPLSTPSPSDDRPASVIQLLHRLIGEIETLIRQELALATAELSRALSAAKTGAAALAVGGAVAFAGVLVLLSAAVLALAQVLPPWLAAVIVGSVVTIVGCLLLRRGAKKIEPAALKPVQTAQSLRRDKELVERRLQ